MIRVASGQAFWGDWPQAPALQVRAGVIDYLILDYLAEVTIAILDKQRRRRPEAGYAADFVRDVGALLPEIVERGIKVIASAGGVHPRRCAEELLAAAEAQGVGGLRVGVVDGDDVLQRLSGEQEPLLECEPLEAEAPPLMEVLPRLRSANVYLGASGIVEALRQDAQIVVTGRCTDTALAVAPMVHEFGIVADDWDALALGTVVGHILECGAQSSGGNFLGDWRSVPAVEKVGFPIAEIDGRDTAVITKHESLGGCVSSATVKEQLLYEIGDPCAYLTADCVADFTSIQLVDEGRDRVRVSGVRGRPAPETLKVSCVYDAGWKVAGEMTYAWPDAVAKARVAGDLVRRRTEGRLGNVFDEWRIEVIGVDACLGKLSPPVDDPPEVVLRVAARSVDRVACEEVGREVIGLVLTGPPGATGYGGGRPRPSELSAIWSGLVPRVSVEPRVEVLTG